MVPLNSVNCIVPCGVSMVKEIESMLFNSQTDRVLVCSSLLLACFYGTNSSRTSLTHLDGPNRVVSAERDRTNEWVWGYFPGQIGEKSEAK